MTNAWLTYQIVDSGGGEMRMAILYLRKKLTDKMPTRIELRETDKGVFISAADKGAADYMCDVLDNALIKYK